MNGIQPGQHGYVALCSNIPSSTDAMRLYYSNQAGNLSGNLDFDGAGGYYVPTKPSYVTVDAPSRLITINEPKTLKTVTDTTLSSTPNASSFHQPVTFTATVTYGSGVSARPTGSVTFYNGAVTLGTGILSASDPACGGLSCAQLVVSNLPVGSNSVTAQYAGDTNFVSSTAPAITQVVDNNTPVGTTILLTSNSNPANVNQPVTLTAAVTQQTGTEKPTGTVTFLDGSNPIGSAALNSQGLAAMTISSLAAGSHSITAAYKGGANFSASTSSVLTEQVNPSGLVTPTATLTVSPNSAVVGQTITFTVMVSSPGGPVPTGNITISDSTDGNKRYGSQDLAGGVAIVMNAAIPAGTYNLVATYGGDGGIHYKGAQSNIVSLQVSPAH